MTEVSYLDYRGERERERERESGHGLGIDARGAGNLSLPHSLNERKKEREWLQTTVNTIASWADIPHRFRGKIRDRRT